MSIEEPYVLATLHKAASAAAQSSIYAGKTCIGSLSSAREVVTAIDSQGINIYNIRSNQVAISYSLSPSTKFHCAPTSHVDRETLVRRTYAALQHGEDDMKLQCWIETSSDGDTEVKSHPIDRHVLGLHVLSEHLLVIYTNGRVERLSLDLSSKVEVIEASAYASSGKEVKVLAHIVTTQSGMGEDDDVELRLLVISGSTMMYHLKMSADLETTRPTTFYEHELSLPRSKAQQKPKAVALGSFGQVALAHFSAKHVDISSFDAAYTPTRTMRIPLETQSGFALDWLNDGQIVVSTQKSISILDLLYSTTQATISLQQNHALLAVIPQKASKTTTSSRSALLLATENDLRLTFISFASKMTLLSAIGRKPASSKLQDVWIQDIPVQSTWKDSIATITSSARTCLTSIEQVASSQEIDEIFEQFLLSQAAAPKQKHKSKAIKDGEIVHDTALTNGHSLPRPQVNGHINGESAQVIKTDLLALQTFELQHANESLSPAFVSRLLKTILIDLPKRQGSYCLPEKTLDFLLRRHLISASTLALGKIDVSEVLTSHPGLVLRIVSDVSGLLPSSLVSILKDQLANSEQESFLKVLSAIMQKLDKFDDLLVTDAIKSELEQPQVERLLRLLDTELHQRLNDAEKSNVLVVSDEVLCATITKLLDSFGVSNFLFTQETLTLVNSLRPAVSQLIAQTERIASTSSCISELLMKARLLETFSKSKAIAEVAAAESQAVRENPEPEARRREMTLDKVKKPEKNQSLRAKAFARVQGIGSVYTIETLQI